MASNQQTSFERSLDLFRRELSDDQIKQMDGANQKTLNDTIQAAQNILGRRNDLCKLTRIQKFLHAMEHVEKLVSIFLNASEFVAFVWGPIKLALMVATTWTVAIRQLIDAYEEIAEALGNLAFFHTLIQSRYHLKLVLEDYFSDILRFHRCVLDVFSRPEWKRLFKWAWGSFRREVRPILESLKRKQALLSDDKLQSHAILKEVQDSSQYAKDQFSNLQTNLEDIRSTLASEELQSKTLQAQEMRTYLGSRLDVSKSRTDLQLESQDPILENSGNWIFSDPTFVSWERGNSQGGSVLFLNGSPGSGKSTLAKTIIHHQKRKQASESLGKSFLTYFFFKHDAADRRTARSMLQHVIMQLANVDETIMRFAYERLSTMESFELADLKKLASDSLTSRPTAILVLDGLDEAIDKEPEISVNWCLNELLAAARSCGCDLKILICGQRDGRLDALLAPHLQIRLDIAGAHHKDVEQFTKCQAANIRARFSLTKDEEESLVSRISSASQGMFLYARVVLDNLASMDSIQEFEDELESDTFPDDLDQAYDRITQRILKKHGPSRHKTVRKILGLVISATRPLRWREIQSRFCINTEKETSNIRNLRRDSCKSICSSLIDVTECDMFPNIESEQLISMVHETASKYLVRNGTINLLQEHIDMALFCCRYLSSRPFTTGKSQDISADIHSGYFGFLDYAAAHYAVHIQKTEASDVSTDSCSRLEDVKAAALALANANCKEVPVETEQIDDPKATQDWESSGLFIQDNVLVVRTLIGLQRENSETAIFDATEGPIRHKCHKIQCWKFATGFSNKDALDEHLAVHERPFRCPHTDCFAHRIGYPFAKGLDSHNEAFHQNKSRAKAVFPTNFKKIKWSIRGACEAGNLDELKRFHRGGINFKDTDPRLPSLLSIAVEAGHEHICRYLVDVGVDPYRVDPDRSELDTEFLTPVSKAIDLDRLHLLVIFLRSGSGPDDTQLASAIAQAIYAGHLAALRVFLTARQPKDHANVNELVLGEIISQARFTSHRPNSHSSDPTPIHAWFQYVKPEFYNEKGTFVATSDCMEYRVYGDKFFRQLDYFHKALRKKCYSLATFLMDIGNDEYLQIGMGEGETPLHCCLKDMCRRDCRSCTSMIQRLLQHDRGKFANMTDRDGRLPAFTAMHRNASQDILRSILSNTRNINLRDKHGISLLHFVGNDRNFTQLISTLLENKSIDLFIRNTEGQTVFSAISRGYGFNDEVALETLFEADPRLAWTPDKSEDGLTPLHHLMPQLGNMILHRSQRSTMAAKFLLTCSEVERVLVEYRAKSSNADRREVRDFAEKEKLREALEIMDSIGFNTT